MEMRRLECPKCKKTMFTKSISLLRCNKCNYHANIKNFRYINPEVEQNVTT